MACPDGEAFRIKASTKLIIRNTVQHKGQDADVGSSLNPAGKSDFGDFCLLSLALPGPLPLRA